ncbi:MAG: hypothetical protein PHW19_07160 [Salinivirgaceae bacterium]|nr:hypothetical protein [Salinivirgaceae bacterium]
MLLFNSKDRHEQRSVNDMFSYINGNQGLTAKAKTDEPVITPAFRLGLLIVTRLRALAQYFLFVITYYGFLKNIHTRNDGIRTP